MAYNFYAGKMASQQLDVMLSNALVLDGSNNEIAAQDGSLVVLGDLVADLTYDANGLEYDLYKAKAPAAATDEVSILDYAGISEGEITGNLYKMGHKLVGIEIPAGRPCRVRRLALHDKFWLGESNFTSKPTVGQYAEAKAAEFRHEPKAALTGGQYGIKILVEKDLVVGMKNDGKQYLCEVVAL